ncbi:MAG: protease [Candidatus Diapherotrites archaeon]|uniref:Protease n=1 Tax=Candidatus Iainarchaeum sp. TaxID=3101447 RepID=A0A2D6LQF0_9ARCH|nr:protease [Candidatus Diapherotrites archaeon]|tara:strand:- start:3429 stop:4640 length:1212 start_codon:yes stop_codon:yes gene_type:complete
MEKPELLVGVANFSCAIAAVKNGADAVYFGVKGFNMRDLGTNFKTSELKKLMSYLRENKVKGYLALNTVVFEEEMKEMEKVLVQAKKAKVDAVICSDLGVLSIVKKLKLEPHISTQASIGNSIALQQYKDLGAERIVLARELSLDQINKITKNAKNLGIEVEIFVHGAMCIAVSGRCFMSHELFGKSANKGECLQVCRRAYFFDGHKGSEKKELEIRGDTILSPKDMKTIEFLDKIIASGVSSLKIEGRTKPSDYVVAVTKCYREAIDSVFDKTFSKKKIIVWDKELSKVFNRGFSTGFFLRKPDKNDLTDKQGSKQTQRKVMVGTVKKYYAKAGVAEVKLIENISISDKIVFEGATTFLEQDLTSMQINHTELKRAKKSQKVGIKVSERVRENDKVFVLEKK